MLKNAEFDKCLWSQGLKTLPAKEKDLPHIGNASYNQGLFLMDTDTFQLLQEVVLSTKPYDLDFWISPQHAAKVRKQNRYSMNNSWRRNKVKRHFPWSPSAQPFPEVRSEARVCVLPLSLLGNKRHSHVLQLGHKDMKNPGTYLGQTPVKTYCQPGFTACSSGQQQSPSQLSKRRMDWGNCCSSSDCKFFKIDLSMFVDGCGWLMVARESNRPAQSHLMWLCTSFQDFSLKIYFCKWFANLKKDPNELFFQFGF